MALDIVQSWHNQLMAQERARVLERIAYGTKASSPQVLMARRMNNLYYSNPLPDNSSGSKNRPIGSMKDESGRPDANQQVAMAQGMHHFPHEGMPHGSGGMRGGVMRNYKYAKMILNRLATDTENINLASQGLPPTPSAGIELSDVDSRNMELDNLLTGIADSIEEETISALTVNELKNVPRLLIYLSASMDENRLVELLRYVDMLIGELEALWRDANHTSMQRDANHTSMQSNAQRIINYLDDYKNYLMAFAEYVNYSPEDKRAAAIAIAKKIFKLRKVDMIPMAPVQSPIPVSQPPPTAELPPPGPEEGEQSEEQPEEEESEEEEAPAQPAPRVIKIKRPTIVRPSNPYEQQNEAVKDAFLDAYKRRDLAKMNELVDTMRKPSSGHKLIASHNKARDSAVKLKNRVSKLLNW